MLICIGGWGKCGSSFDTVNQTILNCLDQTPHTGTVGRFYFKSKFESKKIILAQFNPNMPRVQISKVDDSLLKFPLYLVQIEYQGLNCENYVFKFIIYWMYSNSVTEKTCMHPASICLQTWNLEAIPLMIAVSSRLRPFLLSKMSRVLSLCKAKRRRQRRQTLQLHEAVGSEVTITAFDRLELK